MFLVIEFYFLTKFTFYRVASAKSTFHYWVIYHTKLPTIMVSILMIWAIHFVVCLSLINVEFFDKSQWTIYLLDDQSMKPFVWYKHSNTQTVMVRFVQLDGVQERIQSFQLQKKKPNIFQRTIKMGFNGRKKRLAMSIKSLNHDINQLIFECK